MTTKEETSNEVVSQNKHSSSPRLPNKMSLNLISRLSDLSTKEGSNVEDLKLMQKGSSELKAEMQHSGSSESFNNAYQIQDPIKDQINQNQVQHLCNDLANEIIQNLTNVAHKNNNRIFTTTYVEKKKNQINFRVIKNKDKESGSSMSYEKNMKTGNDVNYENCKQDENFSTNELKALTNEEIVEQANEFCGPKIKLNVMRDSYLDILLSKLN